MTQIDRSQSGAGRDRRRRRASLRGVLSIRERWSLGLMFQHALTEHSRQQDAAQRQLNSLLKTPSVGVRRLVICVKAGVDHLRVEHQDGLILRLTGVRSAMAHNLQASAARDQVELVDGSVREVVYEIRDSNNRCTVMRLAGIRVEGDR